MKLLKSTFFFVFVQLFVFSIAVQSQEKINESQIDELFQEWDNDKSAGMGIGIVSKGELIFAKGYGMANLEHDIPISPTSVFDIASVSKQFAGMAIAMLIKEGKLSEEDDISLYLPDFPDYGHTITVGNLLHHTSGIRDWPTLLIAAGYMMEDVISFRHILSLIYAQKELNFIPGDEYVYSNSNYSLLVQIIEKITDSQFDSWMRNNIFKPLGMKDSHIHIDHRRLVKNKVDSYAPIGPNMYVDIANNLCGVGSSSLYTTVNDLSKWVINFRSQEVGGEGVINMMTEKGQLNDGSEISYGFGIDVSEYKGNEIWSHSGGWAGFRTYLLYLPDLDFGVILLSNHASVNSSSGAFGIVKLYYPDLEDEEVVSQKVDDNQDFDPFKEAEFNSKLFKAYEGSFELEAQKGFVITFSSDEDGYYSQASGQSKFPIFPSSDTSFFLKVVPAFVVFHTKEDGTVDKVTLHQNGKHRANRVEEPEELFEPTLEELREYTGKYTSDELSTAFVFKIKNEGLIIDHNRHGELNLTPSEKDHFKTVGMPGEIKYLRDEDGEITGFRISMMPRTRNILFIKE